MSAHAETPGHDIGPPAGYGNVGHLDRVMLGIIVALASEIMLFGAFFTAFFYVRYTNYPVFPPEPFEMPVDSTAINTAILISSSFTMHWALVSVKRGNRRGPHAGADIHADHGPHVPRRCRSASTRCCTSRTSRPSTGPSRACSSG